MKEVKMISRTAWIPIAALLFGCGPVYRTQYNYTPPQTSEGRGCVSQCEGHRMQCEALQQQQHMLCEQQANMQQQTCRTQADTAYNSCVASGNTSCFRRVCIRRTCMPQTGACVPQYNRCYSTCGGQVQASQVCVRRCE